MDLREKKTKRSISQAFYQLRKEKALEKITVKELAELAEISKATFYLHYRDVFDLNDTLQEEALRRILAGITHPEAFLKDPQSFTLELFQGFYVHQEVIDILFSGNQAAVLPIRIEKELRSFIHSVMPNIDPKLDMLLTYQIQGGFCVSQSFHKKYGMNSVLQFLNEMAKPTEDFLR